MFRIVGLQAQVININHLWDCYLYANFFVTSASFLVIIYFLFGLVVNWVVHFLYACTFILNNMILNEKKISIVNVIADLE